MEEEILKIIQNRISTFLSNPESIQKENAAKEITEHFSAFTEWCIDNTFRKVNNVGYGVIDCEMKDDNMPIEHVYDYYKVNVLKK